jgi:hypothetical protein
MRLLKLFCIFLLFSTVILSQDFGDEGIDAIQPPNPPTDVVATGYNAGIKITRVKSTTIHVDRYYLYEDGNQIDYVNSTGQTYYTYYHSEPTLHIKHTYTVKAAISDLASISVASNTSDAYSIRKLYVSQSGTGDGSSYNSPEGLERVNGSNWETYDRYPYEGFEDGFFMGDTIYFVGTSPFTSAITLPTSGTFPKQVTGMPNSPIFYLGAQAEPGTSGRPQPVFNGGGDSGDDAFQTNGCNYIYIGYLKFEDWGKDKDAITMLGTSNSQVDNCLFNFNKGSKCIKVQSHTNPTQACTLNVFSNNTVLGGTSSDKYDWGATSTEPGDGDFIQLGRSQDYNDGETFGGHIIRNNTVTLQNTCPENPEGPHSDVVQIYRMKNTDNSIQIYQNLFIWKRPEVIPEGGVARTENTQVVYMTSKLNNSDAGGEVQVYNNIILLKDAGQKVFGYNNVFIDPTTNLSNCHLKAWNNSIYSTSPKSTIQITNGKSGLEMKNNIIYIDNSADTYFYLFDGPAPTAVNCVDNFYVYPRSRTIFATVSGNDKDWTGWKNLGGGFDQTGSDFVNGYSTAVYDNPGGEDAQDYKSGNTYVVCTGINLSSLFETDYYGMIRVNWDKGAHNEIPAKKISAALLDIPDVFEISQNYPNPFNPGTNIDYNLPEKGTLYIKVFDILGRELLKLTEDKQPGRYSYKLNMDKASSGIYFCMFTFNNKSFTRKMLLTK